MWDVQGDGTQLWSQHRGGRGRWIYVSLRSAWSTYGVSGRLGLSSTQWDPVSKHHNHHGHHHTWGTWHREVLTCLVFPILCLQPAVWLLSYKAVCQSATHSICTLDWLQNNCPHCLCGSSSRIFLPQEDRFPQLHCGNYPSRAEGSLISRHCQW